MKKSSYRSMIVVLVALTVYCMQTRDSSAHFGMIIPSDQMVMPKDARTISITLMFWHPFEGIGMNLVKPAKFNVTANGTLQDLSSSLNPVEIKGFQTWETDYKISRPGIYVFHMEPQPYWEPAEDCFIIHYTKTVVTAFGDDEGWDEELGLKTEIVPLAKPFGLYAGNVFQGIVKLNGKPVPFSEVEVEYYNQNGSIKAPTDYMITQALKADSSGIFTYAVPISGWWGFAGLNPSDEKIKHNGEEKEVELGAVLWIRFHDMK